MPPMPAGSHDPSPRTTDLYSQAARLVGLGAWECDLATERLGWTEAVYDLFDLPQGSVLRRPAIVELYTDESRAAMNAVRAGVIETGRPATLEAEIRPARGVSRWLRLSIDVERQDGRSVRLFGAKQDITREREAWDRLRAMAERDALTGLANRAMFDTRYRAAMAGTLRHDRVAALALIDFDHFKTINDRLGHLAGDECLRQVARRLQQRFADAILVARIGGDEFAILLRAPLGATRLRAVLERAVVAIAKPVFFNGAWIDIGVSIGAAIFDPLCRSKITDLFGRADAALYEAKGAGRKTIRLFADHARLAAVG